MNGELSEEFVFDFFMADFRSNKGKININSLERIVRRKAGGVSEWCGIDYDPCSEEYVKGYMCIYFEAMPYVDDYTYVSVHIPNKLFFEEFSKALINNRHNTVEEKEIIMGHLSIMGDDLGFTEEEKKNIWDKVKEF